MADRQLKATDIAARYCVSLSTARRYMREMGCMENPLRVWMSSVLKWEASRSKAPVSYIREMEAFEKNRKRLMFRQKRGM